MCVGGGLLWLTLAFVGTDSIATAAETVKIAKISSGKSGTNTAIQVDFDITATANTEYQVRIEATSPSKVVTLLDVQKVTTGADGKKSVTFKNTATSLTTGMKYKISVKLFHKGDNTATATPLATDAIDHTISNNPFRGSIEEPPPPLPRRDN